MVENPQAGADDVRTQLRARLVGELRAGLVERALSLPLGSQEALTRVANLCHLRGASMSEIARISALDEGFAATLLRLSNSAASASRTPISDLTTAVTRLGTRMVGMLAVALPAMRLLAMPEDELADVRKEIHRHTIRVGVICQELAPPSIHKETALTAGLVHNVGLGILSLYARAGLRRALGVSGEGVDFAALEREIFGFTHAELGGIVAKAWNFPEYLVLAIQEHDSPVPESPLGALVHVSDQLVRECGYGIEPVGEIPQSVARRAGVIPEDARARTVALLHRGADLDAGIDEPGAADHQGLQMLRALDELDLAA
jgi:HD-like signal output (HDOD) protein